MNKLLTPIFGLFLSAQGIRENMVKAYGLKIQGILFYPPVQQDQYKNNVEIILQISFCKKLCYKHSIQ
jgi:hypothetical protein